MVREVILVPNESIKAQLDLLTSGSLSWEAFKQGATFEMHAWTVQNSNDFVRILWGREYEVAHD